MTKDFGKALESMVGNFWRNIEGTRQKQEKAEIAADPQAHKLTRMMADGKSANYRYMGATNGRGQAVWFCWSTQRNAAGYFLGWRETYLKRKKKDGTYAKRDQWTARKAKKRVMELAQRRRDRLIEKYPAQNGRAG